MLKNLNLTSFNQTWSDFLKDNLIWFPKFGIGYYPVTESPYDENYWNKYLLMEETEIGQKLNNARIDLVNKYIFKELLDIGIGSGAFVKGIKKCYGFDINPHAVDWLKSKNRYLEPRPIDAISFWDSIEHIHNPANVLKYALKYVFISTPIYDDKNHILKSKHFRPDEHCWYFTKEGLKNFMSNYGFACVEYTDIETRIGREDIGSFVFKRVSE